MGGAAKGSALGSQHREVWWVAAHSADLNRGKPLASFCNGERIVLFRDGDGIARALEDRCPHRRIPLSLGRVLDNGMLQCGYHGWTFDGLTGRCRDIPNIKASDQIPSLYRARQFDTHEQGGLIRVATAGTKIPARFPDEIDTVDRSGTVHVVLDHERYIDAIFDGPHCLFAFRGTRFVDYLLADPHVENGKIILDRHAAWAFTPGGDRMAFGDRTRSEHALTARFIVDAVTGETEVSLRNRNYACLASARIAPVPAGRGTTKVFWQIKPAAREGQLSFPYSVLSRVASPLQVFEHVDAAQLEGLQYGPSKKVRPRDIPMKRDVNKEERVNVS